MERNCLKHLPGSLYYYSSGIELHCDLVPWRHGTGYTAYRQNRQSNGNAISEKDPCKAFSQYACDPKVLDD
jgi:hypothetical protein